MQSAKSRKSVDLVTRDYVWDVLKREAIKLHDSDVVPFALTGQIGGIKIPMILTTLVNHHKPLLGGFI